MSDESLTAQEPLQDRLQAACDALTQAINAGEDTAKIRAWRHEALKATGAIQFMAREYEDAMARDAEKMQKEPLRKDRPPLNWFEDKPMRKAGFIDASHSAEHAVASGMNALLTQIENAPHKSTPEHAQVLANFRAVAQVLDDKGICLDQGKTFAPKTTMPRPDGDDLKTSRVHKTGGIFARLAKHPSSKDDTGHER